MDAPEKKIFLHLDEDFSCQYKDIQFPTIQPPYFHSHNGYEILLLLGGELDFFMESGSGKLVRGDLVCVRPMPSTPQGRLIPPVTTGSSSISGRPLSVLKQQPDRSVLLLFPRAARHAEPDASERRGDRTLYLSGPGSAVRLSSGEWGKRHSLPLSPPADSRHAQPACGRAFRCEPGRHARLYGGALFYIDAHIQDTLTIEQLAGHVHHNGVYLNRRFKQITGLTLNQYILAKKISRAQSCLQEGLTAGEACEQAGFHDYATFYRAFCREMGVSPKQYQQRLVEEAAASTAIVYKNGTI